MKIRLVYLMILASTTASAGTSLVDNEQPISGEPTSHNLTSETAEETSVTLGQVQNALTQEGLSQEQIRSVLNKFNVNWGSVGEIRTSVCAGGS